MGLITWIVFGALAGWVASMIAGSDERQGCFLNIVVGVVGAFIGGIIVGFVTGRGFSFGFNLPSFVVAVIGAIVLLLITGMARRR
jgi:uncharacterized membrane protein YeaQ/YmgE (transglycosylase-associated protein family)